MVAWGGGLEKLGSGDPRKLHPGNERKTDDSSSRVEYSSHLQNSPPLRHGDEGLAMRSGCVWAYRLNFFGGATREAKKLTIRNRVAKSPVALKLANRT